MELHPAPIYEPSPISTLIGIGLSDEELVLKSTRELNLYLKKVKIPEDRKKEIKRLRRKLKNRGYAAGYRKKENSMPSLNDKLRDDIKCVHRQSNCELTTS